MSCSSRDSSFSISSLDEYGRSPWNVISFLLVSQGYFCFLTSVYFFTVLSFFGSIQTHRNTTITINAIAIVDIAPIKIPLIKCDDLFGGSVNIPKIESLRQKEEIECVFFITRTCLIHHHHFLHEVEQQGTPLMIYMACEFADHKDPYYQ